MRSPELERALPELVRAGVVTPGQAAPLVAVARGELVSLRTELRALLGTGVVALVTGVGLFLEAHHQALGPGVIAAALALAAAGCFVAAARRSPPFSWRPVPEPDWIVDGLLLLAIALLGADLAWIETQFTPLGADWPWHLLLMSVVTGALAVRFDSIAAWSLALSTFAAWRGIAVSPAGADVERALVRGAADVRWNLLLCGLVFAAAGWALARADRKRHFEPASTFLAAAVAAFACLTGLGLADLWPLWALSLAALGAVVARHAYARRRLALFALGALALYIGATRFLIEIPGWYGLGCFWFAATSVGAVVLLVVVHRRFRGEEGA